MANADMPALREYQDNPFIAKLPPLLSQQDMLTALTSHPEFDERECSYPTHLRKHCVMRLGRYFEPLERQLQLAERFGMLLRQGYVGRNPLTHDYIRHLQNGAERIEAKSLHIDNLYPIKNTAGSFALAGCSGVGKSKSIENVLHLYPQCIQHSVPFSLVQIVWLKLDSPYQGSPKQLCINFFSAVDRLIGTNYFKAYGSQRNSVDEMMVHMAHVANLHALGVLVVDEIQHLNKSKMGPEALLNFLVTLVNTICVPVILIGTLSAVPMLQGNFRQARRSSGLGSLVWDRLPKSTTWNYFIDQLWKYQWTREKTPISEEIRDVLYDESQGILDIVVKLFMLTQLRVISIGDVRDTPEILTPQLMRKVAREDFRIVQPMIDALRRNDTKALLKYDDLMPLQEHVEQAFASAMQSQGAKFMQQPVAKNKVQMPVPAQDDHDPILAALRTLNVSDDIAHVLINEARAQHPSTDPLLLMASIAERLVAQPIKAKKPELAAQPEFDLRRIVSIGKESRRSGYEALLAADMVKPPLLDIAA